MQTDQPGCKPRPSRPLALGAGKTRNNHPRPSKTQRFLPGFLQLCQVRPNDPLAVRASNVRALVPCSSCRCAARAPRCPDLLSAASWAVRLHFQQKPARRLAVEERFIVAESADRASCVIRGADAAGEGHLRERPPLGPLRSDRGSPRSSPLAIAWCNLFEDAAGPVRDRPAERVWPR